MNIVIATIKSWNIKNAKKFKLNHTEYKIEIMTEKEELNEKNLEKINPDFIFFPHWSWIIPEDIYLKYNCIVFHMTDLPFGRGGSPLQNLISRGMYDTKISAIKVDKGIDTGDIYLKEDLKLYGTADEIFMRASEIIFNKMIPYIIQKRPIPREQEGTVVEFKRRTNEDGDLSNIESDLTKIYDYIRMLDGEGYPNAFIRLGKYKIKFSRASLKQDKILADVEILEE